MTARITEFDTSSSQTVLVVTDDVETATLWVSLFEQKGWLIVSESSAHALQTSRLLTPWLVLVDVKIAHAERLALCRGLKSINRGVLLMLVPLNQQEIAESYEAGVDECIVQPVNAAFVLVKVMSWMVRLQLLGSNNFALEAFI
ncbi:MAG: hypothetical protein HYR93_06350 [Chloroflexi bacterium]|nr:hypothetical protein [Chloroflexota bacterium]